MNMKEPLAGKYALNRVILRVCVCAMTICVCQDWAASTPLHDRFPNVSHGFPILDPMAHPSDMVMLLSYACWCSFIHLSKNTYMHCITLRYIT